MKNEAIKTESQEENNNLPAQISDMAPIASVSEIVPIRGAKFADIGPDVNPEQLIEDLKEGEVGKINAVRSYLKFNERKGPEKFVFMGFDEIVIPSPYTGTTVRLVVAVLMDAGGNLNDNGSSKLVGALRDAPIGSGWEITFLGIQQSGKNNLHDLRVLRVKMPHEK